MWWLLILFLVYFLWMKRREGMSPSPSEMNLAHVGQILKLEQQVNEIKKSMQKNNSEIDDLDKIVQINVENTTALESNMAQSEAIRSKQAYP
jgi:hypothetical protein